MKSTQVIFAVRVGLRWSALVEVSYQIKQVKFFHEVAKVAVAGV